MLNISTCTLEGLEIIVLEGEIDMYVSPKVRETLLGACKSCEKGVAVDLSGVAYMDSSGIATLIEGMQWRRREGGRFLLFGVQQPVMDTLRLAKLQDFFEIYGSKDEALSSFG